MKRIRLKLSTTLAASLLLIVAMAHPASSLAQQAPATVHGHVNNAIGIPVTDGEVKFPQDRGSDEKPRKSLYPFTLDPKGDSTGAGIAPGSYLVVVFQQGKTVDFFDNIPFTAGE